MNRTSRIVKHIVVIAIAVYVLTGLFKAKDNATEFIDKLGFEMRDVLDLGMLVMIILGIVLLSIIVLQNIFRIVIELKYKDQTQMDDTTRFMVGIVNKIAIVVSMLMRLSVSMIFLGIAGIAFFAPNVTRSNNSVYIMGVIFVLMACFMGYSTIRYSVSRLKQSDR